MYHYHPHRVRTDTCSSGSDNAPVYRSSGPSHGRLLRSMTFTALNNLDEESSFASSAMSEIPHARDGRQQQQHFGGDIEDFSHHPLAQSDPSLQTTLAQGRRPSLRPGFEYLQAPSINKAMLGHTSTSNTLHHATSSYSLYSEQSQSSSTTSSSFHFTPSLNSSMDTMALSNEDTSFSSSWYGTSFASTTSHLSTTAENRKRSFSRSLREGANGDENGELGGWLGGMLRDKTVTPGTPSASHTAGNGHDYFTSSSINALQAGPLTSSTSMQSKRPNNISTNTISSPHKPPLMKSYTFDSISSKSPTKKYMRMDYEISALDAIPSPRHQHQFSLLGGPFGNDTAEGGQMMLESPFELGFNGGEGARIR